jgi:peptidoglycan hydrolase-like protein with peptidoglycan-binding domain
MRQLLCKRNFGGLILAVLAAGTCGMPAVAAQNTTVQTKKPVHKSSSGASATHSVSNPATKTPAKSTSSKNSGKRKSKKVKGQAAPTPERISEIQEALARKGVFPGTPTGKWDDSTVEAMMKFQSSNGLNPTGKLDAVTLQKLGFASETAGLGAPTPPPNAAANRLLSRSVQHDETKNEDQTQP